MSDPILTCDIGDVVVLHVDFLDVTGTVVLPDIVTFQARNPHGTITALNTTPDTPSGFKATLVPTVAGSWHVRAAGSGVNMAAAEGIINVRLSAFQ